MQLYSSFNLGDRWVLVVKVTSLPLYRRQYFGTLFQEAGWAVGTARKGTENFAPTGFRTENRLLQLVDIAQVDHTTDT